MPKASPVLAPPRRPASAPAGADDGRIPGAPTGHGGRLTPTSPRLFAGLAALTLALGGLSLLAPSTPSYDPWSWTVWARQIIHGHLTITATGTSWKPLPMIATIPFALLHGAAPDLWLVVARAGAIAAVLLAGRLAHRLTAEFAQAIAAGSAAPRSPLTTRAPALLAGVLAVVALGFAAKGDFITSNGLGYSEGLATALLLVAIECHLDGRHRASFLVGFLVALDRPEIWLFWVPYGLWLGRRDAPMRAAIATAFVLQPIAWFLPVYLGSGHLGASVTRATDPRANSLAYAHDPFIAELTRAALPTVMLRIKGMAPLVVLGAAGWLVSRRRTGGRPLLTAALLGLAGGAWFVVIAVMTEIGFSGNDRYLVLGAALVDVCGAVGFGALAVALGLATRRVVGRRSAGTGSPRAAGWATGRASALLGTGLAAAAFALLPAWIANRDFVSLPRVHGALLYQADLRADLAGAIARAGGRRRVLACGRVMSEGFQVPMVAYALDVPTPRVLAPPADPATPGPAPNVILQTRATRSSDRLPRTVDWPATAYADLGRTGAWRTFTHCVTAASAGS